MKRRPTITLDEGLGTTNKQLEADISMSQEEEQEEEKRIIEIIHKLQEAKQQEIYNKKVIPRIYNKKIFSSISLI